MIPVEGFLPMAMIAVALIGLLGSLLVRERRRNNKTVYPSNPGRMIECPYATGQAKVGLTPETLDSLRDGMAEIRSEAAGLRASQGKVLEALGNQASALAVITDRLTRTGAP